MTKALHSPAAMTSIATALASAAHSVTPCFSRSPGLPRPFHPHYLCTCISSSPWNSQQLLLCLSHFPICNKAAHKRVTLLSEAISDFLGLNCLSVLFPTVSQPVMNTYMRELLQQRRVTCLYIYIDQQTLAL